MHISLEPRTGSLDDRRRHTTPAIPATAPVIVDGPSLMADNTDFASFDSDTQAFLAYMESNLPAPRAIMLDNIYITINSTLTTADTTLVTKYTTSTTTPNTTSTTTPTETPPDLSPPIDPPATLEGLLAAMLIQTGQFVRDASIDKDNIMLHSQKLKAIIPAVTNRWHDTLGELETELLKATAVFEQDLLDVRAKKSKKLAIAEEERRRKGLEEEVAEESRGQISIGERTRNGKPNAEDEQAGNDQAASGKRKRNGRTDPEDEQADIDQAAGGKRVRVDEGYASGSTG